MFNLTFKYGAMGSSKTAQVLMTRFNYLQKGFKVFLCKPALDTRDKGIKSRIGLSADCFIIETDAKISSLFKKSKFDVIICDEAQFLSKAQVEELKDLSEFVPVICYGLLTNFKTELFEGSKRLIELADEVVELSSICRCGRKATVNARFVNGKIVSDGPEVDVGADEKYEGLCYSCYKKLKQ